MKYYDTVSQYDVDRFLEPLTECAHQCVYTSCTVCLKATVQKCSVHGRVIVDNMYEFQHSSRADCTF